MWVAAFCAFTLRELHNKERTEKPTLTAGHYWLILFAFERIFNEEISRPKIVFLVFQWN